MQNRRQFKFNLEINRRKIILQEEKRNKCDKNIEQTINRIKI